MPPKKKSKSKKPKKQSVPTPWDELDVSTLEQEVTNLTNQRNKALQERIQVQTEHDAVRSYYNVTRQQIDCLNVEIKIKVHEVDKKIDDNLEELNSYQEKIQQLNYDFEGKLRLAKECKREDISLEKERFEKSIEDEEQRILSAREELSERQIVYMEEIRQQKARLDDDLRKLKKSLEKDLTDLEKKRATYEEKIENDLDLKRDKELREMEEQKNSHNAVLEERHEELHSNTLSLYSNTSEENAAIILKLEQDCEKVAEAIRKTESQSDKFQEENDRLSEPLRELSTKVNVIKAKVKDKDKNRQSLLNVRSRTIVVQDRLQKQRDTNAKLQEQYNQMKDENEILTKELNATDRDSAYKDQAKTNIESIDSYITEATLTSKKFQEASGAINNSNNENGCIQLEVKGDDETNVLNEADRDKKLTEMAMDAQRSFNKAVWRLRSEVKSASMKQT